MKRTGSGTSPEKNGNGPDVPVGPKPVSAEVVARIREAVAKGNVMFDCCFCHEAVPRAEVSAVGIITRWGHPKGEQAYQQWFCHLSCFERVTGETMEAEPDGE